MNEVLIIARTRMQEGHISVAGLDLMTSGLIRLMDPRGCHLTDAEAYQPGQIWDLAYIPKNHVRRPHVEDVRVLLSKLLERAADVPAVLDKHPALHNGSPRKLFRGALTFGPPRLPAEFHHAGTPFLSRNIPTPDRSLELWWTDRALTRRVERRDGQERMYLIGPPPDSAEVAVKARYAGFDDPGLVVPSGSLVSLSLARWRSPDNRDEQWEKCYMQFCNVLWTPA